MEEKDFDVDEALERLEEINTKLAAGDLSLAESITLYKEGVELAGKTKERLEGVEQELTVINEDDREE